MTNGKNVPKSAVSIDYNPTDGTVMAIANEVVSANGGGYFKYFRITKNGVVKNGISSPYKFIPDADTHITAIYTANPI